MRILRDKFTELKQDSQREIARMSEDRREIHQLLQVAREEYDCLKVVQAEDMTKYQAEIADLRQVSGSRSYLGFHFIIMTDVFRHYRPAGLSSMLSPFSSAAPRNKSDMREK